MGGGADRVGSASRRLLVPRGLFGFGTRSFFFPFPFSKRLWGTRDRMLFKTFQIRNSVFESAASIFPTSRGGARGAVQSAHSSSGRLRSKKRCVQRAKFFCFFFSSACERRAHARPEKRRAVQPQEWRGERESDTGAPGFSPFPGVAPA